MPFDIRHSGKRWQVVNSQSGDVMGTHPSKKKAKTHMRALYANVDDANKLYNPAENRQSGRFAPGQVTEGHQSMGRPPINQWHIQSPGAREARSSQEKPISGNQGNNRRSKESHEQQVRAEAAKDIQQAREIEDQVKMLRAQLRWDREEIAFLSGAGPAPSAQNPGVGRRTTGAAGNTGSAAVAGATSGSAAQRASRSTTAYIDFLHQDINNLRQQIRAMDKQAEDLHAHAHSLLASLKGKSDIVPDITITARALQSLIESYNS